LHPASSVFGVACSGALLPTTEAPSRLSLHARLCELLRLPFPDAFVLLLADLLDYRPSSRLTAAAAARHSYFDSHDFEPAAGIASAPAPPLGAAAWTPSQPLAPVPRARSALAIAPPHARPTCGGVGTMGDGSNFISQPAGAAAPAASSFVHGARFPPADATSAWLQRSAKAGACVRMDAGTDARQELQEQSPAPAPTAQPTGGTQSAATLGLKLEAAARQRQSSKRARSAEADGAAGLGLPQRSLVHANGTASRTTGVCAGSRGSGVQHAQPMEPDPELEVGAGAGFAGSRAPDESPPPLASMRRLPVRDTRGKMRPWWLC
jgi:hypothetical protein